jgi:hypothetical protein
MSPTELLGRFFGNPLGSFVPRVIPAAEIARDNAVSRGQNFAELASAVTGRSECTDGFEPELDVVREQWRFGFRRVRPGAGHVARRSITKLSHGNLFPAYSNSRIQMLR